MRQVGPRYGSMSAAAMEDRLHRLESRVHALETEVAALTARVEALTGGRETPGARPHEDPSGREPTGRREPAEGGPQGDPLGREAIRRLDPDDPHQEATREVPPPPG